MAIKVLIMSSGAKLGLPKPDEYSGINSSLSGVKSRSFSFGRTSSWAFGT
jgi:hypothetical protein